MQQKMDGERVLEARKEEEPSDFKKGKVGRGKAKEDKTKKIMTTMWLKRSPWIGKPKQIIIANSSSIE